MNRRERREKKLAHEKRVKEQGMVTRVVTQTNLFDEIYSKLTSGVKVKCQSIYDNVFCKGER
jgi:hypothetical protein